MKGIMSPFTDALLKQLDAAFKVTSNLQDEAGTSCSISATS